MVKKKKKQLGSGLPLSFRDYEREEHPLTKGSFHQFQELLPIERETIGVRPSFIL